MRTTATVDLSPNDDWQVAWQKINYNFKKVTESINVFGSDLELTDAQFNAIMSSLNSIVSNSVYPIGSIISTSTLADTRLLNGTWVQIFKDRYIMGAGNTVAAGAQGGRSSFTLQPDDLPGHTHDIIVATDSTVGSSNVLLPSDNLIAGTTITTEVNETENNPIQLNPLYEAAYWFKRTA